MRQKSAENQLRLKLMNKFLYIFLLVTISTFSKLNSQNAPAIFEQNLSVVESLYKGQAFDLNTIYDARSFLIDVTGIKPEIEKSFDMPIVPSKKIVKSWRKWYKKNKQRLYWDEVEKKVKVK